MRKRQVQPGVSLPAFFARFGPEAQSEAALEQTRWPKGFLCPGDSGHPHSRVHREGETGWPHPACRKPPSLPAGTIFESTHLPLRLEFLGISHRMQPNNRVAALELERPLGVRYKAAGRLKPRLMEVMNEREAGRGLGERVEVFALAASLRADHNPA